MGVAGNKVVDPPRDRLAHAFRTDRPDVVLEAARGISDPSLVDAVLICEMLARHGHPLADRALGRLVGRLMFERHLDLDTSDTVIMLARQLPDAEAVAALLRIARSGRASD